MEPLCLKFYFLSWKMSIQTFLILFPYIPYISIFLMYFINREGHDPRPVGSAIYIHRFFSGSTFQKCIHRDLIYQNTSSHTQEKNNGIGSIFQILVGNNLKPRILLPAKHLSMRVS